jgi:hypothetical protein
MARVNAEQYADKLTKRLKAASSEIEAGVRAVDVAPTKLAAEKADKWLNELLEAKERWKSALNKVTLEQWKDKMLTKGVPRIPQGIDAARSKLVEFAKVLLPYEDGVLAEIERMPDTTLEDSISRMTHWVRRMADFERP